MKPATPVNKIIDVSSDLDWAQGARFATEFRELRQALCRKDQMCAPGVEWEKLQGQLARGMAALRATIALPAQNKK
jgi:hypothetical protein